MLNTMSNQSLKLEYEMGSFSTLSSGWDMVMNKTLGNRLKILSQQQEQSETSTRRTRELLVQWPMFPNNFASEHSTTSLSSQHLHQEETGSDRDARLKEGGHVMPQSVSRRSFLFLDDHFPFSIIHTPSITCFLTSCLFIFLSHANDSV